MLTKVFQSGNSQAVRIPKQMRFDVDEVEIFKRDNELVIKKIPKNLGEALELMSGLGNDIFPEGREDPPPQERDFNF